MAARFQTFSTSVRPVRVAVLTEADDPYWQSTCLSILEFLSTVWGGRYSVIIPTDGTSVDDVFWEILSAHDPDLILRYQKSGEDLRRNQPDRFEALVAQQVEQSRSVSAGADWRKQITDSLLGARLTNFAITEDLSQQLLIRLAPLAFEGRLEGNSITARSSASYPLTNILEVLPQVDHPSEVIEIRNDATIPDIWLAATFGRATSEHFAGLNARGVPATPWITSQYSEYELMRSVIQPPWEFIQTTPFGISDLGLLRVRSTRARTFDMPTVLVIGDSLSDFCLSYALDTLHDRAVWVPRWFLENEGGSRNRLNYVLRQSEQRTRDAHASSILLTSTSLPLSEIESIVSSLRASYSQISLSAGILRTSSVRNIVKDPLKAYAKGNVEKLRTYQLVDNVLPGPFESPRPEILKMVNPQEHRWMVEVTFRDHRIPRHPSLGPFLITHPNLTEDHVRAGSDGLAYRCPGSFVRGVDLDFNMVRPTIRVPDALDIFKRVLSYCEYECEISDKGRYESEVIEKLGGIEAAADAFRDVHLRSLLDKFLDESGPTRGVHDEGVFLKDERRYLNFAAVAKLLGTPHRTVEVIDDYIAKRILYRGFIFKCGHCSDIAWFSIDELTHSFRCRRCGKEQQYTKSNWRHPDEPGWYYELDEIAYQALRNNGAVPILTLAALRRQTKDSFLFCPELRIKAREDEKHFMEIDVCCIPDGKLCIGEAKANGTLASDGTPASVAAERYRDLAAELGAAKVAFSTSEERWDQASDHAIDAAFETSPHIQVLKLTKSDL